MSALVAVALLVLPGAVALASPLGASPALAPAAADVAPMRADPGALAACPQRPQDCPVDLRMIGNTVSPVAGEVTKRLENETGQNLTGESVDLALELNITNAEIDLVGILFGGGKIESDFEVRGHFEFRAISLARVDELLRESSGDLNVSAEGTFGLSGSRAVVTAEEFRLIAGGALLEAFREAQANAAVKLIEESLPGVKTVSASFEWSNLVPAERLREGREPDPRESVDTREPPIILDARLSLRFLDRISLKDILDSYLESKAEEERKGKDPRSILKDRIKENQTVPPLERSAFMIMGIDQLLSFRTDPGWRLNLTLTVPKGFTIEGATDDLVVAPDKRSATYYSDGSEAFKALSSAGVFTLSNRFLAVSALFVVVLLAGLVLRVIVESAARSLRARARRRLMVRERPEA